jgi:hypothetical protein
MTWKRLLTPEILVILALIPVAVGTGVYTGRWEVGALVMLFSAATGCPGCAVTALLRRHCDGGTCREGPNRCEGPLLPPGI